jgi:hypothetical protein
MRRVPAAHWRALAAAASRSARVSWRDAGGGGPLLDACRPSGEDGAAAIALPRRRYRLRNTRQEVPLSPFPKVSAAGVAATILAVVLASPGSAQQPGERTLTFTERNNRGTFNVVDNPPRNPKGVSDRRFRFSAGDVFVFSSPLFDAANQRRVGRIAGVCNVVKRGNFETAASYCTVGMELSDGSIEFQGSVRFGRAVRIAVVGGTQAYEGARGSLTSTESERTSTDVVHLLP